MAPCPGRRFPGRRRHRRWRRKRNGFIPSGWKRISAGLHNCLKRCPTEAIRVRGGRAHIIDERCIDCGECIRVCDYHAKVAVTDPLSSISRFKYKIALPAPSLYGQFKSLRHIAQVLTGLKHMGFDDVFEVARGADVVTRAIREKLRQPGLPRPLISAACRPLCG